MKIKQRAEKDLQHNSRWQALKILNKVEYQNGYSNQLIDAFLKESTLNDADNRLLVQLIYGVIQRRYTLDFMLSQVTKNKKIDSWIMSLLRLTVYQIEYLDRIPARAAVNEAVSIAKKNGHQKLGNFVNALLRNYLRDDKPTIATIEHPIKRLSIQYSIQEWIVEDMLKQFSNSYDDVEAILASLLENPFLSARINARPNDREDMLEQLLEEGFPVTKGELSPYGIRSKDGNLIHSSLFNKGKLTIQDESSMLVAPLGHLQGHEQVLDACAAPGGKATHIASFLNEGKLTALDLSQAKLNKAKENAERMQLDHKIDFIQADASEFKPDTNQLYDMIYLDAPCSGLGLMRRKPEIKYLKSKNDVLALAEIQLELLNHMQTLLAVGGSIIYSTCTTTQEENEEVLTKFLESNPNMVVDPITEKDQISATLVTEQGYARIWQNQYHTDGFFISRLKKIEEK